jgi:hypothetical protein
MRLDPASRDRTTRPNCDFLQKKRFAIWRPSHNVYEGFEPSIVSVSDDAGHLVAQWLRRVTFKPG